MKYLITGGCGFIGSNLAAEVLKRGEELFIMDNLFRHGSDENLQWLRKQGDFKYYPLDIRNSNDVETVLKDVKPDYIFHLAGQVAMAAPPKSKEYSITCLMLLNHLYLSG